MWLESPPLTVNCNIIRCFAYSLHHEKQPFLYFCIFFHPWSWCSWYSLPCKKTYLSSAYNSCSWHNKVWLTIMQSFAAALWTTKCNTLRCSVMFSLNHKMQQTQVQCAAASGNFHLKKIYRSRAHTSSCLVLSCPIHLECSIGIAGPRRAIDAHSCILHMPCSLPTVRP